MSDIKRAESFQRKFQIFNNDIIGVKLNDIVKNKKKLFIVFGCLWVIVLILLINYKPFFVRYNNDNDDDEELVTKISYMLVLIYSIIISLVIMTILFYLSYKHDFIKKIIFTQ